jgi:F-box and WD-40 domain protein 1/11
MDPFGHSHLDPHRAAYSSSSTTPFRLDEGFSEDTASQDEHGRSFAATAARFQEWVMSQNEEARAEIAYEVLRTLRTSNIAGVVEKLTPLLHMDPLEKLPPEITSQIFSYLDAETLLIASLASKTWRVRIMDSMLWQDLYRKEGWGLDWDEIQRFENNHSSVMRQEFRRARSELPGQPSSKKRATSGWLESRGRKVSADVSGWREQHGVIEADTDMQSETTDDQEMQDAPSSVHNSPSRPNKRHSQEDGDDMDYSSDNEDDPAPLDKGVSHVEAPFKTRLVTHAANGEDRLNWIHLYKQRQKLELNWTKGRYTTFQLPHPSYPQEAHTECIYTIQFYGKWLVSGSRDKTLRVWDLETRRLRGKPLTGHSQSVLCLQFDPTEQEDVIISGSSDSSVIIWRFSTGQKIHEIPSAHEESVLNLRFDHRYLVTCSKDRRIKIWNRNHLVATDKDYPEITQEFRSRAPSYIVATSELEPSILEARMANGQIRALKPYMLLLTLEGHSAAVNAIQIHGDLIVSASGDRLIKIWNAKNGKALRTLQGHQKGIACVQFDSKRIVSGSSDNTVRIYDPITGVEVAELKGHTNLVRTVQAGFGDLPGSDEGDEAKAAERKYLEDLASGVIVEDEDYRRRIRHGSEGSSRLGMGSRLPPGGGGSKWGRIVSGSYDERIIIWRKNQRGDWVIGQSLRQESPVNHPPTDRQRILAAHVAAQTLQQPPPPILIQPAVAPSVPQPPAAPPPTSNPGPAGNTHAAAMSASQLVQQAMNASLAGLAPGLANVSGLGRALGARGESSGSARSNSSITITGNNVQSIASQAAAHTQSAMSNLLTAAYAQARSQQSQSRQQSGSGSGHAGPSSSAAAQQPHHRAHPQNGPSPAAAAAQQQLSQPSLLPGPGVLQAPLVPQAGAAPSAAPTAPAVHVAHANAVPAISTQSRIFKLQFDARRIVCCSQDSRIVGWDFANDDPEVIEACRFFVGP